VKIRPLIEALAAVVPPDDRFSDTHRAETRIRCVRAAAIGREALKLAHDLGADPGTAAAWRAIVGTIRLSYPDNYTVRIAAGNSAVEHDYRALMAALGWRYDGSGEGQIQWDLDPENEDLVVFIDSKRDID